MVQARPDLDFIRFQLRLLESLFDLDFLKTIPQKHPAQEYWSMCIKILERGGSINWKGTDDYYRKLLHMVFQSDTFVTIGNGGIGELRIGDTRLYGDSAVQKKINSRLPDPSQYNPLLLELSFAAYQIRLGHKVIPLEEDSKPDLRVHTDILDIPLYVECKSLESISVNRINSIIKKANKQLKSVDENCYGLIVLDISDALPQILSRTNTDEVPLEVHTAMQLIERAISGEKNCSVSRVILRWSKVLILENAGQKSLFLIKYVKDINHEDVAGVNLLPDDLILYKGESLFCRILLRDVKSGINKIKQTDTMKMCQRTFNFSNDELIDSFLTCDKIDRVYLDENYYLLIFAKRVQYHGKNSYILVCGKREDDALIIDFAFRIPSKIYTLVNLLSPLEMLSEFAGTYGLVNHAGTRSGKFILHANKFFSKVQNITKFIKLDNPEDHDYIQSLIFRQFPQKGGTTVKYALCFAIDTTHLLADLGNI